MSGNEEMTDSKIQQSQRETDDYLKKIRQTVRESKNLLEEVDLRIAETDKFLAEQGLTREQVLNFSFTDEQIKSVNEEFKRRGLPPVDESLSLPEKSEKTEPPIQAGALPPSPDPCERDGTVENRRRKFGTMMQQFRM